MGIRAATVCVAWSRTEWRAYSPRSRLGLPGKRRTAAFAPKKPGARAMGLRVATVCVV